MDSHNTLPQDLLRILYRSMLRIRMVEETIADRYAEQEMRCPVHLSIGQEGTAVGVCAALSRQDYALSGHRCHSHYLAKGGALKPMIAELHGKETGCCKGKGGSMHLVDLDVGFLGAAPIVGSTIPIAVGAAMGTTMQNGSQVTTVFFGDGATEEGVFHESLNFAALKNLPVLFVCENNLYSVYSPLSVRRPEGHSISALAGAHGIATYQGGGNNVAEVYEKAKSAVDYIRTTRSPVFLEFDTYRWREHCGPNYDNDIGYRTEAEFEQWKKRCPIGFLENKLASSGVLDSSQISAMRREIEAEIDEAFQFAKTSPFPPKHLLLAEVVAS